MPLTRHRFTSPGAHQRRLAESIRAAAMRTWPRGARSELRRLRHAQLPSGSRPVVCGYGLFVDVLTGEMVSPHGLSGAPVYGLCCLETTFGALLTWLIPLEHVPACECSDTFESPCLPCRSDRPRPRVLASLGMPGPSTLVRQHEQANSVRLPLPIVLPALPNFQRTTAWAGEDCRECDHCGSLMGGLAYRMGPTARPCGDTRRCTRCCRTNCHDCHDSSAWCSDCSSCTNCSECSCDDSWLEGDPDELLAPVGHEEWSESSDSFRDTTGRGLAVPPESGAGYRSHPQGTRSDLPDVPLTLKERSEWTKMGGPTRFIGAEIEIDGATSFTPLNRASRRLDGWVEIPDGPAQPTADYHTWTGGRLVNSPLRSGEPTAIQPRPGEVLSVVDHYTERGRTWRRVRSAPLFVMVRDGSLSQFGRELVTRPMRGAGAVRGLATIGAALRAANAVVSRQCGLHVHVDVRDAAHDYQAIARLAVAWSMVETAAYATQPQTRRSNGYCMTLNEELRTAADKAVFGNQSRDWRATWHRIVYAARVAYDEKSKKLRMSPHPQTHIRESKSSKCPGHFSRYAAWNLHSISLRGTVENRLHTGTANAQKVLAWGEFTAALADFAVLSTERQLKALRRTLLTFPSGSGTLDGAASLSSVAVALAVCRKYAWAPAGQAPRAERYLRTRWDSHARGLAPAGSIEARVNAVLDSIS